MLTFFYDKILDVAGRHSLRLKTFEDRYGWFSLARGGLLQAATAPLSRRVMFRLMLGRRR